MQVITLGKTHYDIDIINVVVLIINMVPLAMSLSYKI